MTISYFGQSILNAIGPEVAQREQVETLNETLETYNNILTNSTLGTLKDKAVEIKEISERNRSVVEELTNDIIRLKKLVHGSRDSTIRRRYKSSLRAKNRRLTQILNQIEDMLEPFENIGIS